MTTHRFLALAATLALGACVPAEEKDPAGDTADTSSDDTAFTGDVYDAGDLTWSQNYANLPIGSDLGIQVVGVCPAGSASDFELVWGTDTYTDDSSLCTAAVHAGVITLAGGALRVEAVDGLEAYVGSLRNGVESLDYGSWGRSFVVVGR